MRHALVISFPDGDAPAWQPVVQHVALALGAGELSGSVPGGVEWAFMPESEKGDSEGGEQVDTNRNK